jgi:hypothetical protein
MEGVGDRLQGSRVDIFIKLDLCAAGNSVQRKPEVGSRSAFGSKLSLKLQELSEHVGEIYLRIHYKRALPTDRCIRRKIETTITAAVSGFSCTSKCPAVGMICPLAIERPSFPSKEASRVAFEYISGRSPRFRGLGLQRRAGHTSIP